MGGALLLIVERQSPIFSIWSARWSPILTFGTQSRYKSHTINMAIFVVLRHPVGGY